MAGFSQRGAVKEVLPNGTILTLGSGFSGPEGVAVDAAGDVFVGDTAASLTTAPTLSTTATASSHVSGSPYTITASGAVDPNYKISYGAGTLTVTPAPLTITADDKSKVYGAALPTLTASYSGFVNGDTAASLTTAPTLSTTSPYTITASGAVDADHRELMQITVGQRSQAR